MWRSILVFMLLPSLAAQAAAQTQTVTQSGTGSSTQNGASSQVPGSAPMGGVARAFNPVPDSTKPRPPVYRQFTRYNQIRRGRSEKIAITTLTGPEFVTSPRSPVPGIAPLKLELQPERGFTFGAVQYPKASKMKWPSRAEPIQAVGSWALMQFDLRASRDVALGNHKLKGKLTFQTVSNNGVSDLRVLDVEIPVIVGEHDAKVTKADYPYTGLPTGAIVLLIVLSPVIVAAAIAISPLLIYCGIRYGDLVCGD